MADRDDKRLQHFKARATASPNQKGEPKFNGTSGLAVLVIVDGDGFGQSREISKWTHVGTSPEVTSCDISRARRRQFKFMSDQ